MRADRSELVGLCTAGELEEAKVAAAPLLADMHTLLEWYTAALRAHGIQPPF
ncbi:DUF6959 family protein [Actinacidiphila polyblastidii]|uniref:DUF6959 family protein n=1 Tax=Actinacidiphila polyblastidii TaxID=3110430 RepID=UPI0039BC9F6C